ncbi:MAG: DNA repair protein RecN [Bacteroidota bacterium]|nr:DNA repair protein RecN [Bacteroidota bacterium]
MLATLTIQNYALIQELNIDLSKGLSTITGETGAGKSILLGALSLLVGQRADTGVLLDHSRKCIVEGTFRVKDYGLEELFAQYDLDFEEVSVVRREISPDGKSRAFVNDSPVNLSILRDLGEKLIDIHSQHQNLYLENPVFQLRVLDTFAQQADLLQKYKTIFSSYKTMMTEYQRIHDEVGKNKADLEYFQFQYDQLNQAKLQEDEQELLEQELKVLSHSEEIKTALVAASAIMSGEGNSIITLLKDAHHQLSKLRDFYQPSLELFNRLDSALIEMKDIAHETELQSDHIEHNPDRIEFVKQRLDLIYSFQQKHRVSAVQELIIIKDGLKQKIDEISNSDFRLDELKAEIDKIRSAMENMATTISANRQKVIPRIEDRVQELLKELGMHNAIFKVELTSTHEFTITGTDRIRFLFSANKQSPLQELAKVASGGEMARLMLSIKAAISEAIILPTIIFDEIDAGVSGDIADKMGNVIVRMSDHAQVINITHLPQIASKGQNHFLVYKHDLDNKTQTRIKQLKSDERVIEIARMLSGAELSEAAVNNAKALLGIN